MTTTSPPPTVDDGIIGAVTAYVSGCWTLAQLHEWEHAHIEALLRDRDPIRQDLRLTLDILMLEKTYGYRDEEDVRAELEEELRAILADDGEVLAQRDPPRWYRHTKRVQDELRAAVRRFVAGRDTIAALHDWLAAHVQALADSTDAAARSLDGLAWLLISEWSIGDRDEASVRRELAEALRQPRPPAPEGA